MPWKKSGSMEQRTEFALRAMQTLNFRALCQQYGISTKTGYKWRERFWRKRFGRDGRGIAAAEEPFQAAPRGGSVRNSAFEAGAYGLGAAQDPGVVFAWARRGGQ